MCKCDPKVKKVWCGWGNCKPTPEEFTKMANPKELSYTREQLESYANAMKGAR